jgi:WD40 repeat protein
MVLAVYWIAALAEPEIFLQNGHTTPASVIWFSSDGETIYTAARNELKIWSSSGLLLDDIKLMGEPVHVELKGNAATLVSYEGIERFDMQTRTVTLVEKKQQHLKYTDTPDGKLRVIEAVERTAISLVDRASGTMRPFQRFNELSDMVADNHGVYSARRDKLEYYPFDGSLQKQLIWKEVRWIDKLALSGDHNLLAVACRDDGLWLFDARSKTKLQVLDRKERVSSMRFSPDGKQLAVSLGNKGVELIDIATGETVFTLRQHSFPVQSVQFSADGKLLMAQPDQGGAGLWTVANGRLQGHLDRLAQHATFSPDGREIAYLREGRLVRVDARSRQILRDYSTKVEGFVTDLRYSPDGRHVLVVTMYDSAYVWPIEGDASFVTSERLLAARFIGDALIVANLSGMRRYDLKTGKAKRALLPFKYKREPNDRIAGIDEEGKTAWLTSTKPTLLDLSSGKVLRMVTTSEEESLFFSKYAATRPWYVDADGKANHPCETNGSSDRSPDGRWLASAGRDSRVRLYDAKTCTELASLVAFDEEDYVTFTPDNYYVASRGALSLISFRSNAKIFPFEQFDLRLHRPDIILQRLGYAQPDAIRAMKHAYDKRLKKMGFTEAMVSGDLHLPQVKIVSSRRDGDKLRLQLQASDAKYKLVRLNVIVNGVPLHGVRGTEATALEQIVPLQDGRNHIQVSVLNDRGVESLKDSTIAHHKGTRGQRHVVAIGVSKYTNKNFELRYAAKDAEDVATALPGQTIKLLDADATKEKITATRAALMKTGVDDEVIVFVAGHGLLDEQLDYYFATVDVDFEKPALRGLPYDEIEGLLDAIPARKKLLLMDTCHSGEVDKDSVKLGENVVVASNFRGLRKQRLVAEEIQSVFADLRRGTGAMVMSSASGVEFALESGALKNGVFTYAFLDALKKGTRLLSALRTQLQDSVLELTNGQQHPTVRRDNLELDFALSP